VITALLAMIGLALLGCLMFELHERREQRLERLNRESWDLYRASRRIHDETAEALQALFEEARSKANGPLAHDEIDR
jgi:hypothetical protein